MIVAGHGQPSWSLNQEGKRTLAPLSLIDAGTYAIHVQGWLDESWSDTLGGMRIRGAGSGRHAVTTLVGRLADQAALISILNTLYDLGLPILSVEYIGAT